MHNNASSRTGAAIPRIVVEMCALMLGLTVISAGLNFIAYFGHLAIDASIFSTPQQRFGDFTIYQQKFLLFRQASFYRTGFPFTYPAPVALGYEFFFAAFRSHALRAFLIFCALAFLVPTGIFVAGLLRRGMTPAASVCLAGLLLVTSWPMLLVVDRGNMEVLVWVALAGAMYAYSTGRGYLAACLFGLAAALKLFPFVFLALFFSRREWGKLLAGIVVFVGLSVGSLEVLGPSLSVAYHQVVAGVEFFRLVYMAQWHSRENGVDHSLFAFYKFVAKVLQPHHLNDFRIPLAIYLNVTALAGMALYLLWIRRLPILNQLLCLSIASIYFTAFSGDGTLLHLYYPLVLLIFLAIRAEREGRSVPGLRAALFLLGFILSVTTFITWHRQMLEGEAKCVAIGVLLVVALTKPFGPPLEYGALKSEVADTPLPDSVRQGRRVAGDGALA